MNKRLQNILIFFYVLLLLISFVEFMFSFQESRTGFISEKINGFLPFYVPGLTLPDDFPPRIFVYGENMARIYDYEPYIDDPDMPFYRHELFRENCKNTSKKRIIFVGDSITALGEYDNSSYPDRLSYLLGGGSEEYEVLNFAESTYQLPEIQKVFDENVLQCRPDLIIYGFCQNDPGNTPIIYVTQGKVIRKPGIKIFRKTFLESQIGHGLFRSSLVYRYILFSVYNMLWKLFPDAFNIDLDLNVPDEKLWHVSPKYINEMYMAAKEENVPFIVLNIPFLDYNFPTTEYQKWIEYRIDGNITVIDLRDYLVTNGFEPDEIRESDFDTSYNRDILHFNKNGRMIVGDFLYDYLFTEGHFNIT
ncbi:SGNH/GDSL hydrolase family protein [Candidatus Woesearchaeota archaeon]|nr:SGNH/GDSL hydrolase family protein [Candidatus Woesearchaeota archaeon]